MDTEDVTPRNRCTRCRQRKANPAHEMGLVYAWCDECWETVVKHQYRFSMSNPDPGYFYLLDEHEVADQQELCRAVYGPDVQFHIQPMDYVKAQAAQRAARRHDVRVEARTDDLRITLSHEAARELVGMLGTPPEGQWAARLIDAVCAKLPQAAVPGKGD